MFEFVLTSTFYGKIHMWALKPFIPAVSQQTNLMRVSFVACSAACIVHHTDNYVL